VDRSFSFIEGALAPVGRGFDRMKRLSPVVFTSMRKQPSKELDSGAVHFGVKGRLRNSGVK
jgi:hypothetical protein